MDDFDPNPILDSLSSSLDDLDEALLPILEKPWNDTIRGMSKLEEAKMNVLMGYAIHDLVFVYLKLKGIDPGAHPVSQELERIKSYFGKIKREEQGPEKPRFSLDQGAADRFIKHAIAEGSKQLQTERLERNARAGVETEATALNERKEERDPDLGKGSKHIHFSSPDNSEADSGERDLLEKGPHLERQNLNQNSPLKGAKRQVLASNKSSTAQSNTQISSKRPKIELDPQQTDDEPPESSSSKAPVRRKRKRTRPVNMND